jgi:hypothetical protein
MLVVISCWIGLDALRKCPKVLTNGIGKLLLQILVIGLSLASSTKTPLGVVPSVLFLRSICALFIGSRMLCMV